MPLKITTFLFTLGVLLVIALVVLFAMLSTLNGYSEQQTMNAFVAYAILGIAGSILVSVGAALFAGVVVERKVHALLAGMLAIIAGTVVGIVVLAICGVIAAAFAGYFRGEL